MRKKISLVTPCYNEERGIRECYETVKAIMDAELPDYEREHIFCDNASSDRTVEILKEIAAADPSVKIIVNARNFGVLRNTYNGVLTATGDATILFMPADLQDPPSLIPTFVKHWEAGYEIVFGIRARREEPFLSRTARHLYYRAISRMSYVDYPADVGDYQLVDRKVLDAMKQFDDVQPFMRMMPFECGFRSIGVPYTWQARKYGFSQNRISNLIDQGLLGAISFSTVPLRTAFFFGLLISSISFAYAFAVFLLKVLGFDAGDHGIPTIIIGLFFFGGIQLFFLGVLGEYVVAIFNQVRRRPIVVERERINFNVVAHESFVDIASTGLAELAKDKTSLTSPSDVAIRRALEAAGVEIIDDGSGPSVRIRNRTQHSPGIDAEVTIDDFGPPTVRLGPRDSERQALRTRETG